MSSLFINKLDRQAASAMEEMRKAGIPIKEFSYGDGGCDFWFTRQLSESEEQQAEIIAAKYIKTHAWSWQS